MCIDDEQECGKPGDVCITRRTGIAEYEYACWAIVEVEHSSNRHLIEDCLRGPTVMDFRSFQCCNNTNRCNEQLNPPLPIAYRTTTPDKEPNTTPFTSLAGRGSRTGIGLRHDQSIPCILMY